MARAKILAVLVVFLSLKYELHVKSKAFDIQKDSDVKLKYLWYGVIVSLNFSSGGLTTYICRPKIREKEELQG